MRIHESLAFDLDGVVTDIGTSLLKEIDGKFDKSCIPLSLFSPDSPSYLDYIFQNPLFWRNLKPINDAWHKINEWFYSGYDVFFITSRRSDASIQEIERWLDGWNVPFKKVFVCKQMEKIEIINHIKPILFIDDNPFEIEKVENKKTEECMVATVKTWYNEHLLDGIPSINSLSDIEIG